jgi:hypothetical protein
MNISNLYIMMIINQLLLHYFLKIFNDINFNKYGPKYKYPYEHYLTVIIDHIKNNKNWMRINDLKYCKLKYGAYYRFYQKLIKLNIIESTYVLFLKDLRKYGLLETNICFGDSTNTCNKNGTENTNYFYKIKSRKSTKLSTVVSEKGILIASNITDEKNDKNIISHTIQQSYINLKYSIINPTIICDTGYENKDELLNCKKLDINLIYKQRKNAKNKLNIDKVKHQLKKRHLVENNYSHAYNYIRCFIRYDSYSIIYLNTFLLANFNIFTNRLSYLLNWIK